jgi:hypothetical protein
VLTAEWLPRIPWILATVFAIKIWLATYFAWLALRRQLISTTLALGFLGCWFVATTPFVILAWQISPRVAWLRESLILAALLVIPLARIAAAPLTIAANRHR